MKKNLIFLVLLIPTILSAQLGVGLSVNQDTYLLYENIIAKVTLRNQSGKTLIFSDGDNPDSPTGVLDFIIEGPGGIRAEKKRVNFNPLGGFAMAPGIEHTVLVPVNKLYILDKAGTYSLKVLINHNQIRGSYESGITSFSIFNGVAIWERQLGVPKLYYKEGEPEPLPRTIKVLSFYDKENKYFAIMIEDKDKVFNVRRLGYDIGNKLPKIENDMLSHTHMLLQMSPSIYIYYVFDIDCNLLEKEVYSKTDVDPTFVRDPGDASVFVVGGRKAIKDVDYVEEDGVPVMKEDL